MEFLLITPIYIVHISTSQLLTLQTVPPHSHKAKPEARTFGSTYSHSDAWSG